MVNRLKNPPKTKSEVTLALYKCGLDESSKRLEKIC